MEVLTSRWQQIDLDQRTIRPEPGTTKAGAGRAFPFADYPELREVIERAERIASKFKRSHARSFHGSFSFTFARDSIPLAIRCFATATIGDCDHQTRCEWNGAKRRRKRTYPIAFRTTFAVPRRDNMERAAVPRSVAMALGGRRSESMYRRYAIASEADLRDGVRRLTRTGEGTRLK
jgi:hypothetical protein